VGVGVVLAPGTHRALVRGMLTLRSLGFFVVLAAVGCASTSKNDDGSSGVGDSGSLGGNGGTGTGTTDASTSSNTSSSDGVGGNEINSGAGGGISTTSADSSSTGAGGQDDGSTHATTGDGSTADVTSTNGAGGSTSSGGATVTTGGAGGSAGAGFDCPDTPPSHSSECTASGQTCAYEDCDGIGRTVALCFASWEVEVAPCDEPVVCSGSFGSGECGADEVCLVSVSGAVSERCVENTCGDEAVECDCLVGCQGECSVSGDAEKGITMTCNTCLEDTCA
jgi:hypothetical protein